MHETIQVNSDACLQQVLDSAPEGACICLPAGEWREKLTVRTPGITITGAGADSTRIVFDDYAQKIHADGREYNTFRTFTVAVTADHVTMRDLAVINDSLHPEIKGQEVALSVYGGDFIMEDCRLTSTQDTLFAGPLPPDLCERYVTLLPAELRQDRPLRQHFTNCLIEGTVDFIFGCGETLFENCEIRSLCDARGTGYCAAPAHALSQEKGFLFRKCRFTQEAGVGAGTIYLARPWRDYGLAEFENCTYDAHIATVGFDKWNDTDRDKTARFYETPLPVGRVSWARTR